jgi:hypothetical protein
MGHPPDGPATSRLRIPRGEEALRAPTLGQTKYLDRARAALRSLLSTALVLARLAYRRIVDPSVARTVGLDDLLLSDDLYEQLRAARLSAALL